MQISPFGFLMPQASHPTMFPNDVTGLNYQMCNSGHQEKSRELKHASKEESVSSARVGHNSKFPAEKETAPQTLSSAAAGSTSLADKVGFSPMDLVKLAEKPVASSGLTLRTRNSASSSSTPRRVPRKPNSGKSREAADGSNLRRSKSLVSARRSEMPPEPTVVPPKNISWDDGSPELLRNQPQIQGSLFEALSHEDRGQICGVGGAFHSPQTFPFQIESQSRLQNNSPDSVVSFQCSTCVPKPLKQRSKPSTPRSRPLLKTSENPPGIITNSDNTDLDYKTKIPPFPDFEFAKLPNSVATIHQGLPAHFASASNPLLFTSQSVGEPTSFRSLPSPNSNPVTARPPLSSRVTPRNETPKVEFNQHSRSSPERPWITHASASESKSSHVSVVPVKTPSHLGPTTDRTKHLTSKSTYTSTSVSKFTPSSVSATAHVPKLEPATVAYTSPNPSPGFTTKTVEAQKVSNSPGVVASDVVGSLPSQRMPSSGKVAKASPGVTEGRIAQHPQHEIQQQSVPPINVCTTTTSNNNESYISAFDHLPLRCSTPRSLIPSHRPSTGATSDRQGGSSNHMSSGPGAIGQVGTDVSSSGFTSSHLPASPSTFNVDRPPRKPALTDLESFRILTESAIENESELFDTVIEKSSHPNSNEEAAAVGTPRSIPPLSLVGVNGQQPIDSLKLLVRDMTAVTSATHKLAAASLNSTTLSQTDEPLSENSIMTKSTLDALALVERGPDQFNQQVNSHLNSIRTLTSAATHDDT